MKRLRAILLVLLGCLTAIGGAPALAIFAALRESGFPPYNSATFLQGHG